MSSAGDSSPLKPSPNNKGAGVAYGVSTEAEDTGENIGLPPDARRQRTVSLLRYSPAVCLLAVLIADGGRRADPDLWGHLRFGLAMLQSHRLVLHDPYSYSAPHHLWRNHEWLTEVLMAAVYRQFGVIGLKLMKLALSAATVAFMLFAMEETGASTLVQIGVLLASMIVLEIQMQFRPQLFTFLFLAVMCWLFARYLLRGRAPVWLVLAIFPLWANLHGGFIAGIGALLTFTAVLAIADARQGRGLSRAFKCCALSLGAVVSTFITPYGIGMWGAVLHALRDPITHRIVSDWRPFPSAIQMQWRHAPDGLLYYVLFVGIALMLGASVARSFRWDDAPLVSVAALMYVATAVSVRNMALAVIASAAPLARHLALRSAAPPDGENQGAGRLRPPRQGMLGQCVIAAAAIAYAFQTGLFSPRLPWVGGPYPAGAVAFMRRHKLSGNLLCDFNWGEYLIWHLSPPSRVFVDGRYDTVYPRKVISDWVAFYFDHPGAERVLEDYPHDYVLITPKSRAYRLVRRAPGWKLIYRDTDSALFARAGSAAGNLPSPPAVRPAPPPGFFP